MLLAYTYYIRKCRKMQKKRIKNTFKITLYLCSYSVYLNIIDLFYFYFIQFHSWLFFSLFFVRFICFSYFIGLPPFHESRSLTYHRWHYLVSDCGIFYCQNIFSRQNQEAEKRCGREIAQCRAWARKRKDSSPST